jgi:hypothetical protein
MRVFFFVSSILIREIGGAGMVKSIKKQRKANEGRNEGVRGAGRAILKKGVRWEDVDG